MPHKRSVSGQERQLERELLHVQKRIAKWLVDGTKFNDDLKKEQVATLTTEDVLDYIAECHSEPDPECVPLFLDGTVLFDPYGDGVLQSHVHDRGSLTVEFCRCRVCQR